ncbi:MFS transporter [Streptomyces albus]|uniref:MFS transporter n=1 Tax=Streptomyces albus TaxID=1888 RepID=UPI003F1D4084
MAGGKSPKRSRKRSLGRPFALLWAAFAVSAFGTRLAFDAFPLVAILALDAGPAQVSLLAAAGGLVGALLAVPLGPWIEFRRKRPVMVATDLLRCAALLTVPAAYALGLLTFGQLLVVAVVTGAADLAFRAAGGACLKDLVATEQLLVANGRFEATSWTTTMLGPPLGGALVGMFGPVVTVVADAVSYLLSALGIRAIGTDETPPRRAAKPTGDGSAGRLSARELLAGWQYVLAHPALRVLFVNTALVSGLIMAVSPLLAVLMLGRLGFAPWQYGLAFALPCVGGLIGSRLAGRLVERAGQRRVLLVAGTLRAVWLPGLALVGPGPGGLVLVVAVELALITCMGVFNPVFATYRLEQVPADRTARVLSAWSVTSKITVALLTGLWGLLADLVGTRTAIALAALLALATPALLPWRPRPPRPASPAHPAEDTGSRAL